MVSCMFVVVSTLCLIFSTLPRFQQKDENGIIRESSKTMIIIVTIVIGKITKQTLSSSSQYCHAKYYRHNRHHLIIIVIIIVIIVIIIVILNQRRKTFSRSLRLFSSAGSPLSTLCGSLLPRESLSKYIVHGILGKTWDA